MIGVGGTGTILAVLLIMAFLVWVTLPLLQGAELAARPAAALADASPPIALLCDDEGQLAVTIDSDLALTLIDLERGRVLGERRPLEGLGRPTAWSLDGSEMALAQADGSVLLAQMEFTDSSLSVDALDARLASLKPGESAPAQGGVAVVRPDGSVRLTRFEITLGEPIELGDERPIRLVDAVVAPGRVMLATLQGDSLRVHRLRERTNLLTGEVTRQAESFELPPIEAGELAGASRLLLGGRGDSLLLIRDDGRVLHWDLSDPGAARLLEQIDLVADPLVSLSVARFLPGRHTLVVGDSQGRLDAWFSVDRHLVRAHALSPARGQALVALSPSARSRLLAAAWADGHIALQLVTTERVLAEQDGPSPSGPCALALAPREDALLICDQASLKRWSMDPGYPEAGFSGLFAPVWYEGYPAPEHVWQSTGGSDDFEPKLGLWPLVFGTLKATCTSLLFGAPLALLAALFTAEFLPRRARSPIKSLIEMMASLPSVVLGFLAGLVIAPFVAGVLPQVLVALLLIPGCLLVGAALWEQLPASLAQRGGGSWRLGAVVLSIGAGLGLSVLLGGAVERALFDGDIMLWLRGGVQDPSGGWVLLLIPVCGLAVSLLASRWRPAPCGGLRLGPVPLALPSGLAVTLLSALALARGLSAMGLDPRGGVIGPYESRNALVVGFAMGFAIIPIIYTLAEDALGSVPEHLRLASLAAGATPWQTAVRVIVPTAASGLFAAVMIGTGRAVGETMIVLMATGNTPLRDWNLFNGFRTLSANIAVELPEAVAGGTHYRTLFLSALLLFAMTLVLNTLAELVRTRVRRRIGAL